MDVHRPVCTCSVQLHTIDSRPCRQHTWKVCAHTASGYDPCIAHFTLFLPVFFLVFCCRTEFQQHRCIRRAAGPQPLPEVTELDLLPQGNMRNCK